MTTRKSRAAVVSDRVSDKRNNEMEAYLDTLLTRARTETVRTKLRILYAACCEIARRERAFTVPLAMEIFEQISGQVIGESTIRNKRGKDGLYNLLYNKFRQVAVAKAASRRLNVASLEDSLFSEDRIRCIPDVHLQHHVTLLFAKARSLEQQLNILKEERTDLPLRIEGLGAAPETPELSLSDGEIAALKNFVSPRSLKARGIKANLDGSVLLKDGRSISDPGFVSAIEKIIRKFGQNDQ